MNDKELFELIKYKLRFKEYSNQSCLQDPFMTILKKLSIPFI
jgi:hypothetical protein